MSRALSLAVVVGIGALLWYESQGLFSPASDPLPPADPNSDPVPSSIPFGPMTLTPQQAVALQLAQAFAGEFDVADVMGLIEHESSFIPNAFKMDRNGGSYGLMQVTLPAARQMGFADDPAGLFDPATNVQIGCAYLAWCAAFLRSKQGNGVGLQEIIGSYNAGVGNALKGYTPAAYVAAWAAARNRWAQILSQGVTV